ncbi:YihY family inner membrane protein [Marinicella sp. W31]|uniref:YihY family inner membrane protein n=1 Tax=Marinicella sp. W31 TaxID=3023713 RepID=UPI003757C88B
MKKTLSTYLNIFSRFFKEMGRRFVEDETSLAASSLAYTSLLSMVPLMSVLVTVFSAFPLFDTISQQVQDFIFNNFVPSTGNVVQEYISGFVAKARGLTISMSLAVFFTSILMMHTMEKALNRIFDTKPSGNLIQKITMYWAVLTMGPLLVVGGIALTSVILDYSAFAGMKSLVLKTLPVLASMTGFFVIYLIVPNRKVKWRSALAGAITAAIFFEFAKRGFAWYVATIPSYQKVYGALATIPLFLLWLYVSWNIILLGGTLAATLESTRWRGSVQQYRHNYRFLVVLDVLKRLWAASQNGKCVSPLHLHNCMSTVPDDVITEVTSWLENQRLIERNQSGDYLLLQDLAAVSLGEVYVKGRFTLPHVTTEQFSNYQYLVDKLWKQVQSDMDKSVEHIFLELKPYEKNDSTVADDQPDNDTGSLFREELRTSKND